MCKSFVRAFRFSLFLVVLLGRTPASGQEFLSGDAPFYTDHAMFRASDGWTYLEVYLSIPREMLRYRLEQGAYRVEFRTQVEVISSDSVASRYGQDFKDTIERLDDVRGGERIYDVASFYLKEGKYRIRSGLIDLYHKTEEWEDREISVASFSDGSLTLSDVQLAMKISADTTRSKFMKNGYRIIPNPGHLYGLELPVLYHYMEIYNLSGLQASTDSTYSVVVSIHDSEENLVKGFGEKRQVRRGASLVDVGTYYVADLFSGNYQIRIEVIDRGNDNRAVRWLPFRVYKDTDFMEKSDPGLIASTAEDIRYDEMGEDELDREFEVSKYIAGREEKKSYRQLKLEGKRNFLKDFWKQRDTDPSTDTNEFKQDYMARVDYATSQFSLYHKEGWETDRGRILLQYGMPNEIERYPSSVDEKAYQVWHYFDIEGGIQFYFVDIRSFGEMRLVHSTSKDEKRDEDWERWLY